MAFYYCNEDDRILSTDEIRHDYYEVFGEDYESFDDYLKACMYWNNGALIPLADHVNTLKRRLNKVLSLIRNEAEREWYEDEIETLTARIAQCEII